MTSTSGTKNLEGSLPSTERDEYIAIIEDLRRQLSYEKKVSDERRKTNIKSILQLSSFERKLRDLILRSSRLENMMNALLNALSRARDEEGDNEINIPIHFNEFDEAGNARNENLLFLGFLEAPFLFPRNFQQNDHENNEEENVNNAEEENMDAQRPILIARRRLPDRPVEIQVDENNNNIIINANNDENHRN